MSYSANSCLPWYSSRSTTWLAPLAWSRRLLRLAGVERLLEPPDDVRERGAGGEHRGHAGLAQPRDLVGGDDPAPEHPVGLRSDGNVHWGTCPRNGPTPVC